ncbi:Tic20 family protein [Crocosphaera sp. UHCC 0190]|uniref:Tic20 family protein n=1 Tax=Crocosphaera sp. UHCC 0190 TaxID=3110246 RepID=UPI002B20DB86|nr:Tic20 family protein [Crocosphaera sp. UHCC 0190]MEA5509847.1 Tic20 family protein [Crocosphaera sp. UHCC 0190]
MTWRGSIGITDRIFGTLVYCFAIFDTLSFGSFLLNQFPVFNFLLIPAVPIGFIYGVFGQFFGQFGSFILFMILFLAVVRNERVSHFIRYNAMQSILIGILLALLDLVMQWVLIPALGLNNILMETLFNVIFLGGLAASYFSMIQSALGRYAEIPTISEAAYSQVRW